MHTIDLLKGEGVPAKTTLGSVFFVAVAVVVPIIIAAVMISFYLLNNIKIDVGQNSIAKSEEQIANFESMVSKTRDLEQERDLLSKRLKEVSRCVDTFVQWSPILIALSKEMPHEMIMNQLEALSSTGRVTGRKNNDPNKPVVIPMPKRTITFDISGGEQGSYSSRVQTYQDNLQLTAAFEQKFKAQPYSMEDTGTGEDQIETYFLRFETLTQ